MLMHVEILPSHFNFLIKNKMDHLNLEKTLTLLLFLDKYITHILHYFLLSDLINYTDNSKKFHNFSAFRLL